MRLIEIGGKQDRSGDETSLERANKRTSDIKRGPTGHESLGPGYQTPGNHHRWQHNTESVPLDYDLHRKFGGQKANQLNSRSLTSD